VSFDWVKIATESKLKGLKKVIVLEGQNHNFGKLRAPKV